MDNDSTDQQPAEQPEQPRMTIRTLDAGYARIYSGPASVGYVKRLPPHRGGWWVATKRGGTEIPGAHHTRADAAKAVYDSWHKK